MSVFTRLKRFFQIVAAGKRLARLESAITDAELANRQRIERVADPRRPHVADAIALLGRARLAHEQGELQTGWALVFRAERAAAAADSGDELALRAVRLRAEAKQKLSGWRQSAALEALGCRRGEETLPGVQTAMDLISERAGNVYYQGDILTGQVELLGLVLAVVLVIVLLFVNEFGQDVQSTPWAALLGALGGALGAVRSVTSGGTAGMKIPEQIFSWPVTIVRPVVGAAAGVAAFLLLKAGIITVGASAPDDLAPLGVSLLSGLSERYFLSLVQSGEKS